MARKICPACKHLNGGSATSCSSCDQPFDPASVVAAGRPTTRRCPGCSAEVPRALETCACGHTFTDVREHREHLEDRVRVGWSYMALGAALLGASAVLTIATSGSFIIVLVGGPLLIGRGFVVRRHAKADLTELRAVGQLPTASVVR